MPSLPDRNRILMSSPERSRSRPESFRHAFAGLAHVLRSQRNAWIHAAATAAVFLVSLLLALRPAELAMVVFAVGLVWIAELLNTAIEVLVDLVSPGFHPLAKVAKDVGAAAVLVSALSAAAVGLLILGPPLITWFGTLW